VLVAAQNAHVADYPAGLPAARKGSSARTLGAVAFGALLVSAIALRLRRRA
jgi:hypothetical protein